LSKVCITGASGFVGQALCLALVKLNRPVRGVARTLTSKLMASGVEYMAIDNLDSDTNWTSALAGVDFVIHCAARAHVMKETETDSLTAYRSVNVNGSKRLAEQAAAAGVRRLVYVSSIKAKVESIDGLLRPFVTYKHEGELDALAPDDHYGASKREAEQALWAVAAKTGLELVVVRPSLVYGPGVKGNLASLIKLVRSGVPLPFGAVHNQRSMIGLDNLVDLLIRCVDHPKIAGQTLLVSDGEDVSTPELLRLMATAMGRSLHLFPVPVPLLWLAGCSFGKRAEIERLVGSLQIDSRYTRELLEWTPTVSLAEGIRRMVHGS